MPQQTFGVGTVPLVLKVGERVTLICSSGCAGFISVPGEAVAQTITAGTSYDYGGYSVQREVVVSISAGTVAVNFNADGSQFWTQSQADGLQALVSGAWKIAQRPLTQAATSAVAGSPTITDLATGTSGIVSAQWITKDNACFAYFGPTLAPWTPNPWRANFIATDQDVSNFMEVTFATDAAVLELVMVRNNSRFLVFVDDQPALSSQIQLDAAGVGNLIKIDNSTRKWRTYKVCGFNMPFGGIYIGASDSVAAVVDDRPLMTVSLGDSYTQGTGAGAQSLAWGYTLSRLLGCRYWADGIGSTGWTSTSSNAPATRLGARANQLNTRVAGVTSSITADLNLWALGYNDAGGDMVAARTAFDAAYAAATRKPDFIVGPWTPLGATANLDLVRTMLQTAASVYGLTYIDIRNLVNSVNKTALTGGDNVHPTQAGHDHLAYLIAQAMQGTRRVLTY